MLAHSVPPPTPSLAIVYCKENRDYGSQIKTTVYIIVKDVIVAVTYKQSSQSAVHALMLILLEILYLYIFNINYSRYYILNFNIFFIYPFITLIIYITFITLVIYFYLIKCLLSIYTSFSILLLTEIQKQCINLCIFILFSIQK